MGSTKLWNESVAGEKKKLRAQKIARIVSASPTWPEIFFRCPLCPGTLLRSSRSIIFRVLSFFFSCLYGTLSLVFCSPTRLWLLWTNSYLSFSDWCFLYLENCLVHRFWKSQLLSSNISSLPFSLFPPFWNFYWICIGHDPESFWTLDLFSYLPSLVTVLYSGDNLKSTFFNSLLGFFESTV